MALIWKSRESQGGICCEKVEVVVRDMKDSF